MRLVRHFSTTIEQNVMSLLQNSTNLNQLHQIQTLIIKTSLDSNNFVLAKLLTRTIARSSNLLYARSLFDEIPYPDTFIWNTMIRAYLNFGRPHDCLMLFFQMQVQNGEAFIDGFTLSVALRACGRLKELRMGQNIHARVFKLGLGLDLFVSSALIEMYAKIGDLEIARRILDDTSDPDFVCYNVLLAEYTRAGEINLAHKMFDEMPVKNSESWNTMIHGYASIGDLENAKKFFYGTTCERDLVSWSSMIAAHAKNRQPNEALKLFHEMQSAHVKPDKMTMVSVLSSCGDVGALGMGKMVHEFIERARIEIDLKLGTSLVDMYAKCGDIDNSVMVFNGIVKKDVFAWSAMIMGLASHGFGQVALEYFHKMISENIKPNDITFIGILSACSHIRLVDRGKEYFSSMNEVYGITPKIEHYGCMVDILGRAGKLEEARDVIANMPFTPDAIVWRALLGACRVYKNEKLAEEAIVNLVELEPHADGNYVLLSNIYSQAKKWDKVVNVRRMMKNIKIHKVPGSSSIEINNVVHEFIAGDKSSHPQFKKIEQMLAEMTDRLKHTGYQPLTNTVLQDLNEQEKESALAHHSEKLAVALGLLSMPPGTPIRIVKNLRVCDDCHVAIKLISGIYDRTIIIRDRNRFHHFIGGCCSCKDHW